MRQSLTATTIALLTEEQKAKLPKRMQRLANKYGEASGAGQPKDKGKKKKTE
jgi:hypothetical protein